MLKFKILVCILWRFFVRMIQSKLALSVLFWGIFAGQVFGSSTETINTKAATGNAKKIESKRFPNSEYENLFVIPEKETYRIKPYLNKDWPNWPLPKLKYAIQSYLCGSLALTTTEHLKKSSYNDYNKSSEAVFDVLNRLKTFGSCGKNSKNNEDCSVLSDYVATPACMFFPLGGILYSFGSGKCTNGPISLAAFRNYPYALDNVMAIRDAIVENLIYLEQVKDFRKKNPTVEYLPSTFPEYPKDLLEKLTKEKVAPAMEKMFNSLTVVKENDWCDAAKANTFKAKYDGLSFLDILEMNQDKFLNYLNTSAKYPNLPGAKKHYECIRNFACAFGAKYNKVKKTCPTLNNKKEIMMDTYNCQYKNL